MPTASRTSGVPVAAGTPDREALAFLTRYRPDIAACIETYLENKRRTLAGDHLWGGDVAAKYARLATRGKMVRGALVLLAYSMGGEETVPEMAVQCAAALEIVHSALLVHDDIIDRSPLRRNVATVHAQYSRLGASLSAADPSHFGMSMGLCAGNIGYFLALELLASAAVPPGPKDRILSLCVRELMTVGLAEMQDVYLSVDDTPITEQDILGLYLSKTARYTFSLPLLVGGMLAGLGESNLKLLDRVGKPVGLDVREGKKTLFYYYLAYRASPEEWTQLQALFGKRDLTAHDLERLRTAITRWGIRDHVTAHISSLARRAQ